MKCSKCFEDLDLIAYDAKDFTVDEREAKEYRTSGIKVGDLVCANCMHEIMDPTLFKSRDPEDIEALSDIILE